MEKNEIKMEKNEIIENKSFSNFMSKIGNRLVEKTLTDPKRRTQFIANIITEVSKNPELQACDSSTIVSAGLQAEVLHFPLGNQFGYGYLVPFKENKWNPETKQREVIRTVAQFMVGYKGLIQLAIRTGQYRSIEVTEVKEGELKNFSPLKGYTFEWNRNYEERKRLKTIGYVGAFELMNGFEKMIYISYDEMLDHADRYSKAFNASDYKVFLSGNYPKRDEYKYSSFWYKDFDEMAKKTVIRQLLSKWGIMSVELQDVFTKEQNAIENESYEYIENLPSKDFEKTTISEVKQKQIEETATIQPNLDDKFIGNDEWLESMVEKLDDDH